MKDFTLVSEFEPFEIPQDFSVAQFLLRKCKEYASKGKSQYIIDSVSEVAFDFGDFDQQTGSIASFFYKRGMRRGDTLIYMPLELVHLPTIFTGVWRANGIMRASYPEENAETLRIRVEESRAGWVLCEESSASMCLEVAEQIYWGLEVIVIGEFEGCTPLKELYEDDGSEIPELEVGGERPALILCTSGTTGMAKGAVHSHTSLMNMIVSMANLPTSSHKRNLLISKATHVTGSVFTLCAIISGQSTVVMAYITKENLFNAVERFQPGYIWGFPTFLLYLVNGDGREKYNFTSIEYIATGGAAFNAEQEKEMTKLPNLKGTFVIYGMTECCPMASVINFNTTWLDSKKLPDVPENSTGKVFPGCLLQIRDLETFETLGPNQRGEIFIKSNTMFRGYFNRPEATEEAFSSDGFFKTGDVAYYDENEFIFICDRYKDIFKYAGNHVSPSEIEEVLSRHRAISEACVGSIPDPEGKGDIPRAYVTIKKSEEIENLEGLAEEIKMFAEKILATYKHLRGGLFIVSELPKGKTGKITRNLLSKFYEENQDKIIASCLTI